MEGYKFTKTELKNLKERWDEKSNFIKRATVDTIQKETTTQQEARLKRLLNPDNYNELFNYYFGIDTFIPMADCNCAWYHTAIYKDMYNDAFSTIFNLIFRGGAKSTHANMGYFFALKQAQKARFFLTIGQTEPRAAMLLQDLQVQFEFNKRIINDFGVQKSYGNWADGVFETLDRCTFMSLGIDQPFRGLRQNGVRLEAVSIDDIEDKKTAQNNRLTDERVDKITADVQGAFSTRSERTIVNNNYFVKKGFVEKLARKKGIQLHKIDTKQTQVIKEKYAKLYLVNLTNKYYDQINEQNQADWQPSWQERFPHVACLRKIEQYKHDKETLSGEFYNTPINVGKKITESMIKMVKALPLSHYDMIIENWDLAYSDNACYKAKGTIAVKGNRLTVVDVFCRQSDIGVALKYHYKQANEIFKQNNAYMPFFDASVAQEAVYTPQWRQAAIKYKSFHIPMPQKSNTDKYIKIDTTLIGALVSGILDFSDALENNPDWEEAKTQMLNFEKGGKYPVDFPDALTDAIIQASSLLYDDDMESSDDNFINNPILEKKIRGTY